MKIQTTRRMILSIVLISLVTATGCSQTATASTACPLPALPPESTTSTNPTAMPPETTDTTQQTAPEHSENVCSGGTLSPSQAYELIGYATAIVMIIDTRTGSEYAAGHLPGAINMPSNDSAFWDHIRVLPRGGTYFIYCRSGSTTRAILTQMVKDGFTHACHLDSGFNGWSREGFPVEKGAD